jgi:16S rRNA (cytosine967-C5)-methyltransferase
MTPAARIAAAIELLDGIFAEPRPADGVVSAFFRKRRYIGAKDRSDIAERVYAALRQHARLGWWLDRAGHPADDARPRIIAQLMLADGLAPAALEALFGIARYGPPPLDEAEARLANALAGHTLEHPHMPPPVLLECPDWAFGPLEAACGARTAAELQALLGPAALDLRVNELRGRREQVLAAFRREGIEAAPTPLSPIGIRIQGRPALAAHSLFRSGVVEIQDEGSQIAALLVDARPGHQVADVCAGAGGKSLALAARMQGKGRIVACDVAEGRLIRTRERLRRAGVDNIEPRLLTSERDPWIKRQRRKFDRVLVDAPCSGTGAWRRNPDARWRPVDLTALTALQTAILDSACRLVKPGGRLVYVTCSLLADENERQVAAFLEAHQDFAPVPVPALWPAAVGGTCPEPTDALRLTPARHGTDGFFIAVMERAMIERAVAEPEAVAESNLADAPQDVT